MPLHRIKAGKILFYQLLHFVSKKPYIGSVISPSIFISRPTRFITVSHIHLMVSTPHIFSSALIPPFSTPTVAGCILGKMRMSTSFFCFTHSSNVEHTININTCQCQHQQKKYLSPQLGPSSVQSEQFYPIHYSFAQSSNDGQWWHHRYNLRCPLYFDQKFLISVGVILLVHRKISTTPPSFIFASPFHLANI